MLDPVKPIRDTKLKDFEANVSVNLSGVFNGTKAFIHHVRTREGPGTLVNISSGAAAKGYPGWAAYCSSKAGVDRLTECALLEEQSDISRQRRGEGGGSGRGGVLRAYSIAPGVIDTDMQATIRSASESDFPLKSKFIEIKANDQFNTPPYVAQKILEFALADGEQTLPVVQRLPNEK